MDLKSEKPPKYYEINEASGESQNFTEPVVAQLSMIISVLIFK
jgi:hypothetical protein